MFPIEALQLRIAESELGQEWINNPLLDKDVWSLEELGYSKDELNMREARNLHFEDFSLSWLKLLTKLTILSTIKKKHSFSRSKNYFQSGDRQNFSFKIISYTYAT